MALGFVPFDAAVHEIVPSPFITSIQRMANDRDIFVYHHKVWETFTVAYWVDTMQGYFKDIKLIGPSLSCATRETYKYVENYVKASGPNRTSMLQSTKSEGKRNLRWLQDENDEMLRRRHAFSKRHNIGERHPRIKPLVSVPGVL